MFKIRKTGEGYYLAVYQGKEEILGSTSCNQLKHEMMQIIKPHREISVDIKGVKGIRREGLRILNEMMHTAVSRKCAVRFIHVEHSLGPTIAGLKERRSDSPIEQDLPGF